MSPHKTLLPLLGALLAALLILPGCGAAMAHQTQINVTVKQVPKIIRHKDRCSKIANSRKSAKCVACVTRNKAHIFRPFEAAGKRCQAAPERANPAIAAPTVMRTKGACEKHVSDRRTQAKCVACVTRKKAHHFTPSAAQGQRCKEHAPPPTTPSVIRSSGQCKSQISDRRTAAKCNACVTRKTPHTFQPGAPSGQRCQQVKIQTRPAPKPAAVPQAPRTLRNAAQCKAQVSDRRKAAKCVACVTRSTPHLFDPHSPAGQRCQAKTVQPPAAPAPPPAPRTLRNSAQCKAQVADKRLSAKCNACVTRKSPHVFMPDAASGKRCIAMAAQPATRPQIFTSADACKSKLGNARDAAKCVACVTRKAPHLFKPDNPAGKRCEARVSAPPPGIQSAAQCKARVANRRDKAKCVACVTRKSPHSFFPKRGSGKRCSPR